MTVHQTEIAQIEQHCPYLVRYAMLQLRNASVAQDVVQDTLAAALGGLARFAGHSPMKTWLTGILKHKIIDHHRRAAREQPLTDDETRSEGEAADALFREDGHWDVPPNHWGDPERALDNKRFLEALEKCTQLLPAKTARVFMMRDVMQLETSDICKELGISATHCWVMLHRARLALRECLQNTWFGKP
ncbi:MAG: sigma-70 family RNA polymerase sigma factor [Betaproteobacteria bacterium]|nr:sigma-70 family RNA polymerase sigma factor [Betaproteobacteria bacterium]